MAGKFLTSSLLALAALLPVSGALALDPAQPFRDFVRQQWGIAEGLPQVSVLSIEQDAGGFIWVGTQNGIARFDGMRFTPFDRRGDTGHVAALVRDIARDRAGNLWFAHARGVLRHDGQAFEAFEARPTALPALAVAEAPDGRILVATPAGLYEAREDSLLPAGAAGEDLAAIAFDGSGGLWLGANGALLEQQGDAFRRHPLPIADAGPVIALAREGDVLWAGTRVGLFAIDATTGAIRTDEALAGVAIESLLLDADGTLWIGARDALRRRLPDATLLRHGEDEFLADAWVAALFEDRDGHLWVGSQNDSLFRLSDGWIARFGTTEGLRDPLVWSLALAPDGSLTVGTNSGIERFVDGRFAPLVEGRMLPDATAYEIAWDPGGRLWVGTRAGLARIDTAGGPPVAIEAVGTPQVNAIVPTGDDEAWVGTSDGVFRWRDGTWRRADRGDPAPERRIRGILPLEGDERALLATEGGVRLLEDDNTTVPGWAAALEGSFVTALDRVQPDLIIVSTFDRGFGVLIDERLVMIDREDELATLSAWGARLLRQRVHVSAAEGVVSVPVDDLRERWRNPEARLDWRVPASIAGTLRGSQRARCCNGGARSRLLVDGERLWLPTLDGLIALDVDRIDRVRETPIVHIEQVRHAGRGLPRPAAGAVLQLDDATRDLTVAFTAIAHRDPLGLRFEYRLDGFDADWVAAGERREAFYTNLPPGEFTFRVRAESSARVTSVEDAAFAIEVVPHWHERTGVRVAITALLGLLLASLTAAALRWRERVHAGRERALQAEVASRTTELAHANDRLRAANRALAQDSETDLLTGLRNRRWLLNHLGDWLRDAPPAVDGEATCALFALFDLDRFKDLNARFGQGGGDALLRQFASMLQKLAGPDAAVTRWGGEEFLLVQRGLPRAAARARVQAIWRAVQDHLHPAPDGTPILLPCSVGYALHPLSAHASGVPWSVSVELADAATLRVRRQARNSWAGLLLAHDADPALLASGTVGRLDTLLDAGVLAWDHPGA